MNKQQAVQVYADSLGVEIIINEQDIRFLKAWNKALSLLPYDTALFIGPDGPGYRASARDRMGRLVADGWSVDYDEEWGFGEKGVPATYAGALEALIVNLILYVEGKDDAS